MTECNIRELFPHNYVGKSLDSRLDIKSLLRLVWIGLNIKSRIVFPLKIKFCPLRSSAPGRLVLAIELVPVSGLLIEGSY